MKAKLKFFLYGALAGVFISGLTIVLIQKGSNRLQSFDLNESSGLSILLTDNSSVCQNSSSANVSSSGKLDINLSSLEEFKSLPGIGDVKAKNIIDFRKNMVTLFLLMNYCMYQELVIVCSNKSVIW